MVIGINEKDFSQSYPVDDYKSFIWTDRYDTSGDFEIYIPIETSSRLQLKIDNYVFCDRSTHLMVIEDIKTESDIDNGNFLIVTGKSLESLPSRRIVWNAITFTDEPLQTVIKTLLEKSIINPDDQSRAIPNFIFQETTDERITSIDKVTVSYNIGDNVGEAIEDLCTTYQVGFQVIPNENNQFVFSLYMGVDRSYSQETNPWIIFSPNQDNIVSSRFNESTSNYKNVTLVINEQTKYDETGGESTTETKGLVLGSASGISRRETFTDANGIDVDEETTEHDLLANMRIEGYKTLSEYKYDKDFDGEVDHIRSYQYGTDFYLGDIVEIQDLFGNEGRERVTEYMIKEDTNGFSAYPTFTSITENNTGGGYSYELKLGVEHGDAFYGDWGKEAYDHAHTIGNPHKTTWSDVGADELGAADAAYEKAKGDAQAAGNQALRNANIYTDNQIRKLAENTAFKDWNETIVNAVNEGVTDAKKYTDTELETAKDELTDYIDSKDTEDRSYADSLIEKLVGQAPEELDTIYELAQAIKDTTVVDTLTAKITDLERTRWYHGAVNSGKNYYDLVDILELDPDTPVTLTTILEKIKEKKVYRNGWIIGGNAQDANTYTDSLFESGQPGILVIYPSVYDDRFAIIYYAITSGNEYHVTYKNGTWSKWSLYISNSNDSVGALFNRYPHVGNNGVMEIGRYLDFHYASGETQDNAARIQVTGASTRTLNVSDNLDVVNNVTVGNDIIVNKSVYVGRIGWNPSGVRDNGYDVIADIQVTASYTDSPLVFEVVRRHAPSPMEISVTFAAVSDNDPGLLSLTYQGTNYDAKIWKTDTSKWRLVVKRSETADEMLITRFIKQTTGNANITWTKALVTELPTTGVTTATLGGQVAIEIENLKKAIEEGGGGGTAKGITYSGTPVGCIMPYMGDTPPSSFLACDGTVYNITDYPELSEHIRKSFGKVNQFGGDGTKTFAVPDLRGEFIRGTGTNSHAYQGNGGDVGEHQDATEMPMISTRLNTDGSGLIWYNRVKSSANNNVQPANVEYYHKQTGDIWEPTFKSSDSWDSTSTVANTSYTSRPTNTSVLFCIRYKTDILLQTETTSDPVDVYKALSEKIDKMERDIMNSKGSGTPVGHIMPYMGKTPPRNYLACDGKTYNIADYYKLANHIKNEFGTFSAFGGDGDTTFAVPDLRGEFIRGTGTNSHANQGNGADVGEHQDATTVPDIYPYGNSIYISQYKGTDATPIGTFNGDKEYFPAGRSENVLLLTGSMHTNANFGLNTVRPTNTSVLFCIRFEEDFLGISGAAPANSYVYEYSLGSKVTDEQSADIRSGKFEIVRTGGYWTINGRKYWVGGCDYRYNMGDTPTTEHHVIVFPDKPLYNAKMNTTNIVTGGYIGSAMYKTNIANARTTITNDFSSGHILQHRELFTNQVGTHHTNSWSWYNSTIDLMNQNMVYGAPIFNYSGANEWIGYDTGIDAQILPLFAARPDLRCSTRESWWLRDVPNSADFAYVNGAGLALTHVASNSHGVRPAFLVY